MIWRGIYIRHDLTRLPHMANVSDSRGAHEDRPGGTCFSCEAKLEKPDIKLRSSFRGGCQVVQVDCALQLTT